MRKGRKSFFAELLISFLLLLCIPITTILLILWQSNKIVKEQVLDIEGKNLHLYVEQLEEVMENMKDICHTVYSSSDYRYYAYEMDNNGVWAYDLRKKVMNTLENLYSTDYYDVFLYYYNDRIISGRHSPLNAADYYAAYYSGLKVDVEQREAFLDILKSDYKKPVCHIINEGSENSYLCMTMGVRNAKSLEANYTICVVLKPEYLEQLLVMQSGKAGSEFQVYNTDKKLLFSNNPEGEEQHMAEPDAWEDKEHDVWLDEKNYMVQIKESSKLDNYYVYTVSSELFWNRLRWLRIFCYTGVILCVFISVAFAYRSAVRAYQPVENIMNILNRKRGNPSAGKVKSEFLHITSFIENQEKLLKENKKISREWFLRGLLEGKDENVNADALEKSDISFRGEQFIVCILHADILNAEMEDLCSFTVQNVLEELFDSVGKAYFVGLSKNRYALLISMSEDDEKLSEILQYGQEFLMQNFQIVLSIGYSDSHKGIHAIPEAYNEAQEAIRYRFLMGNGVVIRYREIKARSAGYRKDEESKVFMLLMEYIENKRRDDGIDNFVEQLMYIYQMNEEMSVDAALVFKNEIVSALGRAMELCGYEEESSQTILSGLKNAATLSDFRQQLSFRIMELGKCSVKRKPREDILEETKRFIDENYSDYELSVAGIGNQMGMQSAHLSKIFKEKYGVSILDYVTNVRIFHAKRLIREEGRAVQEAAEKTGFLSSTVFIRAFKKKEGITPGKYKEMMEQK